jgi:hypothetical protein
LMRVSWSGSSSRIAMRTVLPLLFAAFRALIMPCLRPSTGAAPIC